MPKLLLQGGLVFDDSLGQFTPADVLVEGAKIADVRPGLTADCEHLDVSGTWIIPGMIDMHVHLQGFGMEALPLLLGTGVTTVRDLGGEVWQLKQMKLDVDSGKVAGPEIVYSGPFLNEEPTYQDPTLYGDGPGDRPFANKREARDAIQRLIEEGAGSIKMHSTISEQMLVAIIDAVAGRVPTTAHLGRASSVFALQHGVGGLEHLSQSLTRDLAPPHRRLAPDDSLRSEGYIERSLQVWAEVDPDGPEMERWLRVFVDSGAFLDPTVAIYPALPGPDDPRLRLVPLSRTAARRRGSGERRHRPSGAATASRHRQPCAGQSTHRLATCL